MPETENELPPGFKGTGPVPKEALDYFRHKGLKPGFDYRDVWREEHAYAFTVAKAMKVDVLTDLREAVDEALSKGLTFEQFRKGLEPKLAEKGWWGRQTMTDPKTGEEKEVQLGSPRRLKTIYRTNLRTARAAGQWQRIERTKGSKPYLVYLLGPSRNHRDDHVEWHGTCLKADDPWWDAHMPPLGYGCRCHVRQVSEREFERMQRDGVPDPTAPAIRGEGGALTGHRERRTVPLKTDRPATVLSEWKNKRTGDVELVPKGITPGFDTNPGKLRLQSVQRLFTTKLEGAPAMVAQAAIRDAMASREFEEWFEKPEGEFPVLRLSDAAAEAIGARHRVAVMSEATLAKQREAHPELGVKDYSHLPVLGDGADVIVKDQDQTVVVVRRITGRSSSAYVAAVKSTRTGQNTFVTSFRRASREDVQRIVKRGRILLGKWG